MKFTNEYIEMVSKAEEIQGLCQHKEGDYFYWLDGLEWKIKKMNYWIIPDKHTVGSETFYDLVTWSKQFPWLPTLEDLFEIVKPIFSRTALELNYVVVGNIIEVLIGKCDSEGCGLDIEFTATSLETGLLRAIMAYQYNKSWNPDTKQWEAIK